MCLRTPSRKKSSSVQQGAFESTFTTLFCTIQYGSEKTVRNIFILVSGEGNGTKMLWLTRGFTVLTMRAWKVCEAAGLAFIQFMECTKVFEKGDKVLG